MRKMILNQPRGNRNGDVIANDGFKKQLLAALKLMEERLPADLIGLDGKVADSLNTVAARIDRVVHCCLAR